MNMDRMIINPLLSLKPDAQLRFEKIMQTIDFSICTSDYDVAKLMFKTLDNALTTMGKELAKFKKEHNQKASEGESLPETTPTETESHPQILVGG